MLNDLLGDKLSFEYGNHHVSHGRPTNASAIFHWGERQFIISPHILQEVNNCFLENNFCYWVSGCYFFCGRICHQWPYLTNKLQAFFSWKIVVFFTKKCTFHFVCMSFFSDMLIRNIIIWSNTENVQLTKHGLVLKSTTLKSSEDPALDGGIISLQSLSSLIEACSPGALIQSENTH